MCKKTIALLAIILVVALIGGGSPTTCSPETGMQIEMWAGDRVAYVGERVDLMFFNLTATPPTRIIGLELDLNSAQMEGVELSEFTVSDPAGIIIPSVGSYPKQNSLIEILFKDEIFISSVTKEFNIAAGIDIYGGNCSEQREFSINLTGIILNSGKTVRFLPKAGYEIILYCER